MTHIRTWPSAVQQSPRFTRWYAWGALLLPVLAVLGPFLSVTPGSPGMPYGYRIVWLVLGVLAVPLALTAPIRREKLVWYFTAIALVWAIWAPLTLLWSPAPRAGKAEIMASGLSVAGAWVALVITRGRERMTDLLRISWVIGLSLGVVMALIETWTRFHLIQLVTSKPPKFSDVWVLGFRHNPNDFCATMVIGSIAALALLLRTERRGLMLLLAVPLVITGYVTIATSSRAAMLGLSLACGLALIWAVLARSSRATTALRAGVIGATLLSALVFNGVIPGTAEFSREVIKDAQRVQPVAPRPGGDITAPPPQSPAVKKAEEKASDNKRLDLSVLGLKFFATSPVIGHGAGYWQHEQPKHSRIPWPESLHNSYLQMGVSYGIIGVLPVIMVYLTIAWRLFGPSRWRGALRSPRAFEAATMALFTLLFSVMGSYVLGDATFWLALAYAAALVWRAPDDAAAAPNAGATRS